MNSYRDIESLGSGILEIDALTGEATFNGRSTGPLSIAGELHLWLIGDCDANNIARDQLQAAHLTASLDLTKANWNQRRSSDHWFDHKGAEIVWRQINRCVIECHSVIRTDEAEYFSHYNDIKEWPEGFSGPL